MDPNSAEAQAKAMHIFATMAPLIGIFVIVAIALYIIPLWQICKKAGLSGPLSLLAIIPGIGKLIVLYVIAFSDWRVVAPTVTYQQPYPPAPYPPTGYPPQGPVA